MEHATKPKIGVVSLYTENISDLADLTNPSKQQYCEKWGYDFICNCGTLDPERPPAWSKILLLRKLLDSYDWLYWIDTDALIMNPETSLEDIIDDRYSMVVAKLESEDLFGELHLNTGSFFIKSDDAGKKLLDAIYGQQEFTDHMCWEQQAFVDLYVNNQWVRDIVKVEYDSKRFNSSATVYDKGDFVFHAVGPVRTMSGKMNLINKIIDEDKLITYKKSPGICVALVYTPEFEKTVFEYTTASLISNQEYLVSEAVHFIKLQSLNSKDELAQRNRHIILSAQHLLDTSNAELVLIAQPGLQFFNQWKRRMLVALNEHDIAISQNHETQQISNELILIRNNTINKELMRQIILHFDELSIEEQSRSDLMDLIVDNTHKRDPSLHQLPTLVRLPSNEFFVGNTKPLNGLQLLDVVVHSTSTLKPEESISSLQEARTRWNAMIDRVRNTVITEESLNNRD